VETKSLRPEDARELERLIKEADFFALPVSRLTRLPDMLQYKVRIDDGVRSREITFDSQSGEPGLLDLVDRVAELSRASS
jgi:hypothetical protein